MTSLLTHYLESFLILENSFLKLTDHLRRRRSAKPKALHRVQPTQPKSSQEPLSQSREKDKTTLFYDQQLGEIHQSKVIIQKLSSMYAPSDIKDAFRYDLGHDSPSLFLDLGILDLSRKHNIGCKILRPTSQGAGLST